MNETLPNNSADIISQAVEKIKNETSEFNGGIKERVIHTYVGNTLIGFCEQDTRFAEVLLKTKRTISDCCKYCLEGVTQSISDIDVYRRAVQFYFPNSEISMNMTITTGDIPDEEYINKKSEQPEFQNKSKKSASKTKENIKNTAETNKPAPAVKTKASSKASSKKSKKKTEDRFIQLSLF